MGKLLALTFWRIVFVSTEPRFLLIKYDEMIRSETLGMFTLHIHFLWSKSKSLLLTTTFEGSLTSK